MRCVMEHVEEDDAAPDMMERNSNFHYKQTKPSNQLYVLEALCLLAFMPSLDLGVSIQFLLEGSQCRVFVHIVNRNMIHLAA